VVQIEILRLEFFSTILADVIVSLVDVLSGKFHLPGGEFVVKEQEDDTRYLEIVADGSDYVVVIGGIPRKISPILETEGIERTPVLYHHLCVLQVEEAHSSFDRAYVNGLPQPVENQHMFAQNLYRQFSSPYFVFGYYNTNC